MGQHWTPRHLLRGFSPDGERVWLYDKRGLEGPKLIGINSAAQSNRAFSRPVEKLMSTIEGAANPVIDVFRKMTKPMVMDDEAKLVVSYYLAMFVWHRDPAVRKRHNEQIRAHAIPVVKNLMRDRGVPSDEIDKLVVDKDLQQWLAAPNSITRKSWHPNAVIRLWFSWMTWVIFQSESTPFIVPDITMITSGKIGGDSTQVFLPLSEKRILMASWSGGPSHIIQVQSFSRRQVHFVNKHGIEMSSRSVYASTMDQGLNRAIKKSHLIHGPVERLNVSGDNENLEHLGQSIENYDELERTLCFGAPKKQHEWSDPVERLVSGLSDFIVKLSMCKWCGCRRIQYKNGTTDIKSGEVDLVDAPLKNWWQRLELKAEDNQIIAVKRL